MLKIFDFNYDLNSLSLEADKINSLLQNNNIVVLKNIIPAAQLDAFRGNLWTWGTKEPYQPPSYNSFGQNNFKMKINNEGPKTSLPAGDHAFDMEFTPTNYVLYRLGDIQRLQTQIPQISIIAHTLETIFNTIAKTNYSVEASERLKLNLEVNHYPSGGGHMGLHNHKHHPTNHFSVVLELSKRGVDYRSGSTCFLNHGETIDTATATDQGDVLLFPADINHLASPCDANEVTDYQSSRGRWTALIPIYKSSIY